MFVEKQSLGQEKTIRFAARQSIVELNNPSVYALADLCIDYFEDEHADYQIMDTRRNRITHDFLKVGRNQPDSEDHIDPDILKEEVTKILRLAKSAVLYAVSAVNMAEHAEDHEDRDSEVITREYLTSQGQPYQ